MINRKTILLFFLLSLSGLNLRAQVIQLADTTRACFADSVLLDAGPGFISYLWNTGEQTQTIWALENGRYSVYCTTDGFQVAEDSTVVMFFNAPIDQPDTIYTCYKYPVLLCVEPDTLKYLWTSNDPALIIEDATAPCVTVYPPNDTTTVYVHVTDSLDVLTCVDSVQIWLYPRMYFDEVNQINMGCPGTCRGQIQVLVSGGLPPYTYLWKNTPIIQRDSIAFGLCEANYDFEVQDQYGCKRDTTLEVKVFEMPTVNIIRDPEDQVYIKNPTVSFSFENLSIDSIQVIDWNWDFGDTTYSKLESPVKSFEMEREYDVMLKYTTSDECIDSVIMKVDIAPVTLSLPNVFTPNGDPYNQYFEIENLEHYISNEIKIFNRYGKLVYSKTNYGDQDEWWDGDKLMDGVYFYVLKATSYFGIETYKGSVSIMR